MTSSDWIIIPTIGENKIHVPNHQAEYYEIISSPMIWPIRLPGHRSRDLVPAETGIEKLNDLGDGW